MYDEISNKEVRCRKSHECAWCGEAIDAGSKAQSRSYRFDGDFVSDWMHPECYAAMRDSPVGDLADGWHPGDFRRGSVEYR